MSVYLNLFDHLEFIKFPENGKKCRKLLEDHRERFYKSPGSLAKHQAWPGGYISHVLETINIGISLYQVMTIERPLPFLIDDFVLVFFLHDLEKPFKYVEPKIVFNSDADKTNFINKMIKDYDIKLEPEHENALKYIHGEGSDYSSTERIQGPLAAFCHICDTVSARIWFDYPEGRHV